MKPEDTHRDPESWYGRIKSGKVKVCPVEACGGKLVHNDTFTFYECEECGWADEFQDLQDMGWAEARAGWPRVTRTCVVCQARSDGGTMPTIEFLHCPSHVKGHMICRWRLDDEKYVVECDCSKGLVSNSNLYQCPVKAC